MAVRRGVVLCCAALGVAPCLNQPKQVLMTRRDFELIARTIADLVIPEGHRDHIARAFAVALAGTNARFDAKRFIQACGAATNE